MPQYQYKGSFEGWMKRITINTAIQKYREKSTLHLISLSPDQELVEEMEFKPENSNIDVLLESIQKLPDRYRLVFNLYVLDNYSHKEISELLNISVGASKSNLSRARQILKKEIELYQEKKEKA